MRGVVFYTSEMWFQRRPRADIHAEDPDGRQAAIDAGEAGQCALRRIVRRDPDAGVRNAAVRRLHDLVVLRQVLEQESDETVRETARVRYRQLLAGGDTLDINYRRAALAACPDRQIIAHVARSAREPALRLAALARVDEPGLLEEVRDHDPDATVRARAADRVRHLAAKG